MHFASADPSPQELWLQERRSEALERFDARTPPLYRKPIQLPDFAAAWAAAADGAPASLFLAGNLGVGKTHTAWQSARAWLARHYEDGTARRGTPVIHTWRSTQLFDALRPEGEDPRGVTKQAQECDLLYIDDLAAARVSPSGWTQERLYELFDERYIQQRPVLITCDVMPNQITDIVGARVASRLAEMCAGGMNLMTGPDRRKVGA